MRISTPILSLMAQRNLATTARALARSMERLASGRRINSARDDAAGLAIASRLESQRRGLNQVIRNLNDSTAFIQSAEGVVNTQTDILQRMKEISIEAANGTLSSSHRTYLNLEVQGLKEELDRISHDATFNGKPLLGSTFDIQVGVSKGDTIRIQTDSSRNSNLLLSTYELDEPEALGTFTFSCTTTGGTQGWRIESGDFNEDGLADTASTSITNGGIYLSFGDDDGTMASSNLSAPRSEYLQVADINGDGHDDIAELGYTVAGTWGFNIWLGNGNGTFQTRISQDATGNVQGRGMNLSDIDGDGNIDLLYSESATDALAIYLGNGNGTFAFHATIETGDSPGSIDTADINGDGHLDLAIASSSGAVGLTIYLGNGNGTFQSRRTLATPNASYDPLFADINNDGSLDLLTGSNSYVNTFIGNGDGTFQAVHTTGLALQDNFTTGDFNDDGNIDYIATNRTSNYVAIAFGNGDGTFQSPSTISLAGAQGVVVNDFNGDGVDDFSVVAYPGPLVSHYSGDSVTEIDLTEDDLNVLTAEDATRSMSLIDSAISSIANHRARLGAYQNRIEHALAVTQNSIEPLSQALSQIRDTDYAEEMAEMVRHQILVDAGLAVISQANLSNAIALDLLRSL